MKLSLTNIKKLKSETQEKLTKEVCGYIIERWNDYDNKKNIFTDVLNYGCQSGFIMQTLSCFIINIKTKSTSYYTIQCNHVVCFHLLICLVINGIKKICLL